MVDYTKYIQKLSVKKDDIILLILPEKYNNINSSNFIHNLEDMLPYHNKVVVIPEEVKLKVIEKDDQKILGEDWWV